jgi:hypothetical protein
MSIVNDEGFEQVTTREGDRFTRRTVWVHTPCDATCEVERNGNECHSCADWSGCGGDCTISGLVCMECGARKDL